MTDEFVFKIAGVPVLMSFAELDKAMQHQFQYEVANIENRICEIFDTKPARSHNPYTCLGKMPVQDAIQKFR